MKISIKKQPSLISISYKNGEYSNNLFCSNLILIKSDPKRIEFDFESIIRSKAMQNSKDDLNYLLEHYNDLETIQFQDHTIFKAIAKYFTQNETFKLEILSKNNIELAASMKIESDEELIITIL